MKWQIKEANFPVLGSQCIMSKTEKSKSIIVPLENCCDCLVAQLGLTLCDPMDYSVPGSCVHGDI